MNVERGLTLIPPEVPVETSSLLPRIISSFLLFPWIGVLAALLLISAFLSFASPYFLTVSNLLGTVALYLSWICIAGFGEALVLISGGLDLSVGSTMGFCGMVCAFMLNLNVPIPLAILIALVAGCGIGLANGLVITRVGLNPFIATLASLSMVRGLTYGIAQGSSITTPDSAASRAFASLGNGSLAGIPLPVLIMVGMGMILVVILNQTRLGRRIYAIGGNENAARLLGLKVNPIKVVLYVVSGFCAAVGGVLLLSRAGTAMPDAAIGYELDVIAAVIIGGTSLSGGRGTIPGVLIGAVLLGVINNGIVLMGLAGYWEQFITGAVIACAAALDVLRTKIQARRGF